MRLRSFVAFAFVAAVAVAGPAADPKDATRAEFFEKKIRPVLAEHCVRCHSAEAAENNKLRGGLLLDSREGVLDGGDSGPAVIPKKPRDSLLIDTLKYDGDIAMPPKGKLPDAVIADFEAWVRDGAYDPRDDGAAPAKQVGLSIEAGREFWAYKPVTRANPPAVTNADWPSGSIDQFILAGLEAKGLAPTADADRRTLIHRVSIDLTGLPPTPEEVEAFAADPDPAAYEKLVDRLLASPRFGERWGRHWLDVARFAESLTLRGFVFKEAWRYRDYVIDSFNADVPVDRFFREQLAGDLLPATTVADRQRQLIATTYLMLGNTNLEDQDKENLRMDLVDEQLDAITKGMLAQTVTCARCHDHKFDPIPTADYYALAGILRNVRGLDDANVSKWMELPLPLPPDREAEFQAYSAQVAALQAKVQELRAAASRDLEIVGKVLAVADVPGIVVDDAAASKTGEWQRSTHSGRYIGVGYVHDKNESKGEKSLSFEPTLPATGRYEVRLAYLPGTSRSSAVPVTVFSAEGEKRVTVDMTAVPTIGDRFVSLGTHRFEKDGQSYVTISTEGTTGHVTADAVVFLPDPSIAVGPGPTHGSKPSAHEPSSELSRAQAALDKLKKAAPDRPMVMSVVERPVIEDGHILVRGGVHNEGPAVRRGFLTVASLAAEPDIPATQSGRVELAEWVTDPDNALTSRVYVNRVWHWLFGAGLVRTVDNFGTTGERPSHPELLDHLAAAFVADGWSTKRLIRTIVLSRTYRQASDGVSGDLLSADPENRLHGRAERRRLDGEALRDKILAVSGRLDLTTGGPTFPPSIASDYGFTGSEVSHRRSVYLPVFRNSPPEMVALFDAANPSMVTGRRDASTVAPQALYLMNSQFAVNHAVYAAERLISDPRVPGERRITMAYRMTLGREPTEPERWVVARYLGDRTDSVDAWAGVFQSLFASAEFRYVR